MLAATDKRAVIWSWLVIRPGQTAHEIARGALGKRGPTSSSIKADTPLLQRMERAGQLTSRREWRPQQGRKVTLWYAVPGAFAIGDGQP
ncbi:MAG TPA: hypothetical protein VJY65_02920 [Chloroflexota bacterium]|nr:hypothetical protein [Chloroflexota bacterium]